MTTAGDRSLDLIDVPPHRAVAQAARNDVVDGFRYTAFVFVVILHCLPRDGHGLSEQLLDQACRFAVPFFFLASGYFLAMRTRSPYDEVKGILLRLLPPFLFWLLFYCLISGIDLSALDFAGSARLLLTGGPGFHLWFLPALGMGLTGVVLLRGAGRFVLLVTGGFVLLIACAFGPYAGLLGLPDPPLGMRNGPFFAFPYATAGYLLGRSDFRPGVGVALTMTAAGLATQIAESHLLGGTLRMPFDFTAGTLLFGTGVFLVALRPGPLSGIACLAPLGRAAFAMYGVHAAFILYVPSLSSWPLPVMAATVVALSTTASLVAGLAPGLRRIVG